MRTIHMHVTRSRLLALLCAFAAFALISNTNAEAPPDQVKDAGAIALTTDLFDKMDAFISAVSTDDAAKAEMAAVGKDPTMDPATWAAAVKAKCPKTTAHFESAKITPEEFFKAITAMMACLMSEDMTKSEDAKAKANAEFLKANNARAEKTFGGFMSLAETKP